MNLGITTLDIYLTGACNYKCQYCYGEDDKKSYVSKETYMKAMDFAKLIGVETIELCGGEPLLAPNFIEIAQEARRRGFKLILRTNAINLPKHIEFIAENFEWVGISLDGLEEINAVMRPSRVLMTTEQQFNIPIECIKKLKELNPNIKILLATVASKKNYLNIKDLCDYIEKSGLPIDKWKIYQFIREKFRSNLYYEDFEMSYNQFNELVNVMPKYINQNIPVMIQSASTEGVSGNCLIVYQEGTINILGRYYGNVNEDKFEDIVNRLIDGKVVEIISKNKIDTYKEI